MSSLPSKCCAIDCVFSDAYSLKNIFPVSGNPETGNFFVRTRSEGKKEEPSRRGSRKEPEELTFSGRRSRSTVVDCRARKPARIEVVRSIRFGDGAAYRFAAARILCEGALFAGRSRRPSGRYGLRPVCREARTREGGGTRRELPVAFRGNGAQECSAPDVRDFSVFDHGGEITQFVQPVFLFTDEAAGGGVFGQRHRTEIT